MDRRPSSVLSSASLSPPSGLSLSKSPSRQGSVSSSNISAHALLVSAKSTNMTTLAKTPYSSAKRRESKANIKRSYSIGNKEAMSKDMLSSLKPSEQDLCNKLGISPSEYIELTEVFRLVDKDGGGTISKDELELLMRTLGIRASKVEMDVMVNEIVNDPTKEEIDLESFVTAMSRKVTTSLPEEKLIQAFRLFDEGGTQTPIGRVKTDMLYTIMQSMGNADRFMKPDDIEDLLNSLAPQALATGHFDYANFVRMLFSS